jgi:hypothetical protein
MLTDPTHTELLIEEKRSTGLMLVAAVCALVVTALVFVGYTYLRKRTAQQRLAAIASQVPPSTSNTPKGPAKAHILVDEALLKGGQTIIGGTVRNISSEKLTVLTVSLELRRRKDGSLEQTSVGVEPQELEPNQEGRYLLKLPAQQYISARLAGLKGGTDSALLAYTTASGQKRPLEKLEPKVVIAPRSGSRGDGFLNSPENPARVP